MKKWWVWALLLLVVSAALIAGYWYWQKDNQSPLGRKKMGRELPLEKYDFDELRKRGGRVSEIVIKGEIEEVSLRREYYGLEAEGFSTREIAFKSEGKWISGMMNYHPERSSLSKVIIMIRGYAEKAGYYPGSGTWKMADELAKAGYVTISLDFLGYGNSEGESLDMLEGRFEKVPAVMDLIASVKALSWVDKDSIGIWAHSNGGQIALSAAEVMGERIPMVLWAPMTNPFPKSVLETIDEGSPVKEAIEDFEKNYDVRRYAFENYYEWMKESPVLIFQGDKDEWCEVEWQQEVVGGINKVSGKARLEVVSGDDHNFSKNWPEVAEKSVQFFNNML